VGNPLRQAALKKGAPEGTCAAWDAPQKSGICKVSARDRNACTYSVCPANKIGIEAAKRAASSRQ
jgi:hypothetical protein